MKQTTKKPIRSAQAVPRFASIEEESEFWDANSPLDFGNWQTVEDDGLAVESGNAAG